jgi:hypothetical protein
VLSPVMSYMVIKSRLGGPARQINHIPRRSLELSKIPGRNK